MRISFHRSARTETTRAKYWFVERDPTSPELFQDELDDAILKIEQFAEIGQAYLLGTRRLLLGTVPYFLVYRVDGEVITIVALAHAKQRPGYWRGR
jgi:plasmid stabilization system protein ParE